MRGINIKFPIEDDKNNNFLFKSNKVTKDALKSKLYLLLLTKKGERYYLPDYGTNLEQYIFEPNDNLTENDVEQELKLTVQKYLPDLEIQSISFSQEENSDGTFNENTMLVNVNLVSLTLQ